MMRRSSILFFAVALAAVPFAAHAAESPSPAAAPAAAHTPAPPPTPAPSPNATEAAFLAKVMSDLPRRYPNPKAATAAGYLHYTGEDETGAISYANPARFTTTDPTAPAQLWYDVKGRLIGADFSVRQDASPNGPSLFGLDAKRFIKFGAHVHYVTCQKSTMKCAYDKAVGAKKYAAIGDVEHPTAEGLVKAGAVKDAADVKTVFFFPAIYDVPVWLVHNPLGQFAEMNPSVIPSARAGKSDDEAM